MPVAVTNGSKFPRAASMQSRHRGFIALLFLTAIAASFLIMKFAPSPFFWLGLIWATVFWAAIFLVHGSWPRAILLNLGVVACLLAAAEAHYTYGYVPPTVTSGFHVHDDTLGWALAKGMRAHSIEVGPASLLHHPVGVTFDVTYTIDANGLRVAPPYREDDSAGTALFFGGSYTFGSGLEDIETLPYQVGALSGGGYRTFNFGVDGYSPAQMLAAIESGMVHRVVDTTPQYAFYIAIPHHVWRVAGRVSWIQHEPRYVLDGDGTVHRAGYFEDVQPLAERLGIKKGIRQLNKSAIWQRLSSSDSPITEEDIRLYLAIVRRSRDLLTAQYPGIQFRIILWPGHGAADRPTYTKMRGGFLRMGIPVYLVEDILPGYNADPQPYRLSSVDPHPNALADRLLAQFVVTTMLQ